MRYRIKNFLCIVFFIIGLCSCGTYSNVHHATYSNGYVLNPEGKIMATYSNGYVLDVEGKIIGTYSNGYVQNTKKKVLATYRNGYILKE